MIIFTQEKRRFFFTTVYNTCPDGASSVTGTTKNKNVLDLECLRIGLENNFDLQIARNEEMISDNNVTLGNADISPSSLNSGYNLRSNNSDQFPQVIRKL